MILGLPYGEINKLPYGEINKLPYGENHKFIWPYGFRIWVLG
jgi:hypothetical protein